VKVVGVGLNKTGTTTLGRCLRHWSFRHESCSKAAFDLWVKGDMVTLLGHVAQFESFEDWPWPLIYTRIDTTFPGSKFILTRRRDPETWFRSLCAHATRTGPTEYRRRIYGHEMPHGHKKHHIDIYERHNQAVRQYFAHRPGDLLEVSWEEGDGWSILAEFLQRECPRLPFPHANKAPNVT
jgi:hypothetical protein